MSPLLPLVYITACVYMQVEMDISRLLLALIRILNALRRTVIKSAISCLSSEVAMVHERPQLFPTVDVPDHAHYTVGAVILVIGITGIVGNFLVIYAFTR